MLRTLLLVGLIVVGLIVPAGAAEENEPPILVLDTQSFAGADIRSLAFSHDDQFLAVGGGKEVRIWNIKEKRLVHTLRGYREPDGFNIGNINGLAFSRDNRYLVVGVTDNTELGSTRIIDLQQPNSPLQLLPGHTGCTLGAANTPDGRYFATWGCAGKLEVFDVVLAKGESKLVMDAPIKFQLAKENLNQELPDYFGFPFDDDWIILRTHGRQFVGRRSQNRILYDESDWPQKIKDFLAWEDQIKPPTAIKNAQFTTTAELQLGRNPMYVRGGIQDGESTYWIGVWNTVNLAPMLIYKQHRYIPKHVALSSSGKLAASTDLLGEIHIWNATTAKNISIFKPGNQELYGVRWVDNHTIQISDQNYKQEEGKYDYNHYGPFTWQLDIETRRLTRIPQLNHEMADRVRLKMPKLGSGRLEPNYQKNQLNWSVSGETVVLLPKDRFMSYAVLPETAQSQDTQLSVVVGTERGYLQQQSQVENKWLTQRQFRGHTGVITSTAVSPNGKLLATSSTDGTVRFWELNAPRLVGDLPLLVEGNRVEGLHEMAGMGIKLGDTLISFDGRSYYERKRFIGRGKYVPGQKVEIEYQRQHENGPIVTIAAIATLVPTSAIDEPLATLFMAKNGESIFWTPDGNYDTTPGGEQYVGWHLNQGRKLPARFFTVGQFRSRFYHPESVSESILSPEKLREALRPTPVADADDGTNAPPVPIPRRIVDAFDVTGRLEKVLPPEVRIMEPVEGHVTSEKQVQVRMEVIASADLREQSVAVLVNGRRTGTMLTSEPPQPMEGVGNLVRTAYQLNLDLSARKNQITVRAKHDRGESNEARLTIEYAGKPLGVPPRRLFFLAIGLENYKQTSLNTPASAADARAIEQAILQHQGHSFDIIETKVLCDDEATVAKIKEAQDWIVNSATQSNDTVLVFLSTKVAYDAKKGWRMLAYEFDDARVNSTTLPLTDLKSWLEDEVSANAMLLVEPCPAVGVLGHQLAGSRPAAWQGTKRMILSACRPDEDTLKVGDQRVFTQAILEAIGDPQKSDRTNPDGQLTFEELAKTIRSRVIGITENRQEPVIYSEPENSKSVILKYEVK